MHYRKCIDLYTIFIIDQLTWILWRKLTRINFSSNNRRTTSWQQVGSIKVQGQPIFVMARPDGRQVWVNFAYPRNGVVQVIDTDSNRTSELLRAGALGFMSKPFSIEELSQNVARCLGKKEG